MTDTQEILVNKKAYLELKASHDRLKGIVQMLYNDLDGDKFKSVKIIRFKKRNHIVIRKALKQAK